MTQQTPPSPEEDQHQASPNDAGPMLPPLTGPGASAGGLAEADFLEAGLPPRSIAALVGFILAIVLVLPWVAIATGRIAGTGAMLTGALIGGAGGLVAVILGIIGIVRTSRRRRRGRGLAIAAIPIGLLAGFLQLAVGTATYYMITSSQHSQGAVTILRASRDEIDSRAAKWYETVTSDRFRVSVSQEEFKQWLEDTIQSHGQLQSVKADSKKRFAAEGQAFKWRYIGQFVKGAATVEVVVGMERGGPKVDDIRVAGSSPLE